MRTEENGDLATRISYDSRESGLYDLQGLGLKIVRETSHRADRIQVTTPTDIYPWAADLFRGEQKEHFYSVILDARHHVVGVDLVSVGSLNASLVHPREVYRLPIVLAGAATIVMHNHPSGDPTPSKEDVHLTQRLTQAGEILGIELLDHLIFAEPGKWYSLKEGGLY